MVRCHLGVTRRQHEALWEVKQFKTLTGNRICSLAGLRTWWNPLGLSGLQRWSLTYELPVTKREAEALLPCTLNFVPLISDQAKTQSALQQLTLLKNVSMEFFISDFRWHWMIQWFQSILCNVGQILLRSTQNSKGTDLLDRNAINKEG